MARQRHTDAITNAPRVEHGSGGEAQLLLARARHARLAAAMERRLACGAALAAALDHARTPEHGEQLAESLAVLEAVADETAALLIESEEAIAAMEVTLG